MGPWQVFPISYRGVEREKELSGQGEKDPFSRRLNEIIKGLGREPERVS